MHNGEFGEMGEHVLQSNVSLGAVLPAKAVESGTIVRR